MNLVASDSGWGNIFAGLTEFGMQSIIKTELSPDFNYQITNGNYQSVYSLPAEKYPQHIFTTFENGSLWFSYVGHGGAGIGPARISPHEYSNMFSDKEIPSFENAQNTIMTFIACTSDELAKSLFASKAGPVATLSSSTITFAYPNTFLQKDLMLLLINDQISTVGEWTRLSKMGYLIPETNRSFLIWFTHTYLDNIFDLILGPEPEESIITEEDIIYYQIYSYNLLGDPALQIAHPKRTLEIQSESAIIRNNTEIYFSGKSNLEPRTKVLVFLKYYPGNIPVIDSTFSTNSLSAYNAANNFILSATTAEITESGDFTGTINVSVPASDAYILEAATLSAPTTVGYDILYIGFPIKLLLTDIWFWWIAILILKVSLIWHTLRKMKYSLSKATYPPMNN